MKKINLLFGALILVFAHLCWAKKDSKSQRGTEFEFTGADVSGRYNSSGEGLAVVEDEKLLADLLQVRKDFKDRVKTNLKDQK